MSSERTLLLIRHGETAHNAEGRWQGQSDTPLSEVGRSQARRLCARLPRLTPRPVRAFSSDLSRAEETARIVLEPTGLEIVRTPLLRERSFGRWEGLSRDEVRARFGDAEHPTGGETWDMVDARMAEALALVWDATPEGACAAVFGHGGSLKTWIARALGWDVLDSHRARRIALGNTGVSVVAFHGRDLRSASARLLRLNDCAHLEEES